MVVVVTNAKYGSIVYEEGFWTGRKKLFCNNQPCEKIAKNTFKIGENETAWLTGNFIRGVKLNIGNEVLQLTPKAKWYEYLLALLPFLFDMVWGNVAALVEIFPIVGGAVGGLICGLAFAVSFVFMRKVKRWWAKVLVALAVGAVAILVCYLVAVFILLAVIV